MGSDREGVEGFRMKERRTLRSLNSMYFVLLQSISNNSRGYSRVHWRTSPSFLCTVQLGILIGCPRHNAESGTLASECLIYYHSRRYLSSGIRLDRKTYCHKLRIRRGL